MKIKEIIENVVSVGLVSLIGNFLPVGLDPNTIADLSAYKPIPIKREIPKGEYNIRQPFQVAVPVVPEPDYHHAILPKKGE